jgi:hypothetical protein
MFQHKARLPQHLKTKGIFVHNPREWSPLRMTTAKKGLCTFSLRKKRSLRSWLLEATQNPPTPLGVNSVCFVIVSSVPSSSLP